MEADDIHQQKQVEKNLLDETNDVLESYTQYEDSYRFVIARFEEIIEMIQKQKKMNKYLPKVDLTTQTLAESYQKIVESFHELHVKAKQCSIMRNSIGKCWVILEDFLKTKELKKLDTKEKTTWFVEIETKVGCSLEFLHAFKQHQDITNSRKQKFPQVWDRITIQKVKDPKQLKKDNMKVKKILHTVASAVLSEQKRDFALTKVVAFGLSFPKYTIMSESGKLKSLKYYRKPTLQTAQMLWNLQENGAIRQFSKLTFDGIKTNRKIYLPPDGLFNNRTDILTENPNNITVRILYNKKLKIFSEGESLACCVSKQKQPKFIDTVILHMHGGGFIALSSRSMQIYTRKWANQLDVPVFSVDYRMPPDHPFPQAPHDCLLVYKFLIHHVHKFMNVRPTNIYVSGDSAGGNLALSLTGLIMKHKQPIPRGIFACYPATDLRMIFSESRMFAVTDVLLWPSTLLLCLGQYLGNDNSKSEDPVASPALLTEEYVNGTEGDKRFPLNWPKTIITVGTKDPLCDDSLMMMQKMVSSNIDCKCILYQELSHGYMNTDKIIEESEKTVKQSIELWKELIAETSDKAEKGETAEIIEKVEKVEKE